VYRSCYLCCHHLWVATVLVWFTKTCNLLFSAAWNEIHIPFLQKSVEVCNSCVSQDLYSCVASESFVFRKHDVTAVLNNSWRFVIVTCHGLSNFVVWTVGNLFLVCCLEHNR
jgi:hypothetical protein